MAPKTPADPQPSVPSSIATPPEETEPWRQSSFDLHQGLEVTEIQQNVPAADGPWWEQDVAPS